MDKKVSHDGGFEIILYLFQKPSPPVVGLGGSDEPPEEGDE